MGVSSKTVGFVVNRRGFQKAEKQAVLTEENKGQSAFMPNRAKTEANRMERALIAGDFAAVGAHILPIAFYAVGISAIAVLCFLKQMKKQ